MIACLRSWPRSTRRAAAEVADVLEEAVQTNRRIGGWNAQALGGRIAELPRTLSGVRCPPSASAR